MVSKLFITIESADGSAHLDLEFPDAGVMLTQIGAYGYL